MHFDVLLPLSDAADFILRPLSVERYSNAMLSVGGTAGSLWRELTDIAQVDR